MMVIRRIVLLALVSVAGIALLAPLAARSAVSVPVELEGSLLDLSPHPPVVDVDRGTLSARSGVMAALIDTGEGAETIAYEPLPTPASVPSDVTLHAVPTPPPPPPTPAPAPARRVVTYDGDTV